MFSCRWWSSVTWFVNWETRISIVHGLAIPFDPFLCFIRSSPFSSLHDIRSSIDRRDTHRHLFVSFIWLMSSSLSLSLSSDVGEIFFVVVVQTNRFASVKKISRPSFHFHRHYNRSSVLDQRMVDVDPMFKDFSHSPSLSLSLPEHRWSQKSEAIRELPREQVNSQLSLLPCSIEFARQVHLAEWEEILHDQRSHSIGACVSSSTGLF